MDTIISLCNSHARRQFVDVISHFPDEVEHVLNRYAEIWVNDLHAKTEAFTPVERLVYHQTHSQPVMPEIKSWGLQRLKNNDI